jgi:hypothetical protein
MCEGDGIRSVYRDVIFAHSRRTARNNEKPDRITGCFAETEKQDLRNMKQ